MAKITLDLKDGRLEVEGEEEFVIQQFSLYKDVLAEEFQPARQPKNSEKSARTTKKPAKSSTKQKGVSKRTPKTREIIEFEVKPEDNKPSFVEFYNSQNVAANHYDKILVIGYYITQILGKPSFAEGQVEFAYTLLKIVRPKRLHQAHIDTKNNKKWIEESAESDRWILTRLGQLEVEDYMPRSSSTQ